MSLTQILASMVKSVGYSRDMPAPYHLPITTSADVSCHDLHRIWKAVLERYAAIGHT